ncbi:MAG: hypothetical protein GQE15_17955 [Archangiaceae bacterium]|nr:hypothetical protein [Archangiaceae bacterium]
MVLLALTLELLACPPPETSRFELIGVLDDDDPAERVAVLRDPNTSRSFSVRQGDLVEGSNELQMEGGSMVVRRLRARVERIEAGSVLLDDDQGLEVASSTTAWVERRGCRPLFDVDAARDVAAQARIVPAFERGVAIGFKLFSIRPGSAWREAGLQNGDVIERVNGLDLNSPEKALVVYSTLRCARRFVVEVRRGDERLDLTLLPPEDFDPESLFVLAPRTLLARAGLRNGDVIVGIEGAPLTIRYVRSGERRRALISSSTVLSGTRTRRAAWERPQAPR